MRIAVFGKPGGGKSTLSQQIAATTRLPLHQLDLVQYERGGARVPDEQFAHRHAEILASGHWVVDGFGNPQVCTSCASGQASGRCWPTWLTAVRTPGTERDRARHGEPAMSSRSSWRAIASRRAAVHAAIDGADPGARQAADAIHCSPDRNVASPYIQSYTLYVRFGWDARKSDRNLRARGFDFEFATQVFDGPTLERADTRRDYGERRVVAIGRADGITLTLVYTDRAEAVHKSVASSRPE